MNHWRELIVMIKVVGFVKKRKDLTREQFKEYWLTKHNRLEKESVDKNPVKKIVASFVLGDNPEGKDLFDGMVELYFSNIEEMKAQMSGPQPGIMKEDEKNFCDPDFRVFLVTEEYLMAEKAPRETGV